MSDTIAQPEAPSLGAQLAASRHSARSYARSIAKRWPALSEEQRAEVRAILRPITALTASTDGGARTDG